MSLSIRAFEEEDQEAVVELWQRCGLAVPWNDPRRDIARKLLVQREGFLVAEENGAIVGSVMAGYDGHRGWLSYLAVAPEFQRRGVGRALVEQAQQVLEGMGCPKITLQVRASNTEVVAFYERLGFVCEEVLSMGKRLEVDGLGRKCR